jgi:hypothetical protein
MKEVDGNGSQEEEEEKNINDGSDVFKILPKTKVI